MNLPTRLIKRHLSLPVVRLSTEIFGSYDATINHNATKSIIKVERKQVNHNMFYDYLISKQQHESFTSQDEYDFFYYFLFFEGDKSALMWDLMQTDKFSLTEITIPEYTKSKTGDFYNQRNVGKVVQTYSLPKEIASHIPY